jgi:hypothetical protein
VGQDACGEEEPRDLAASLPPESGDQEGDRRGEADEHELDPARVCGERERREGGDRAGREPRRRQGSRQRLESRLEASRPLQGRGDHIVLFIVLAGTFADRV